MAHWYKYDMHTQGEETLRRFVPKLSARYDEREMDEQPLAVSTHMYPHVRNEADSLYMLPSLSLARGNFYNSRTSCKMDHRNIQRLLSRTAQYNHASAAASSLLRNLVLSFGRILELELKATLLHLSDELDSLKDSEENRHMKKSINKAFTDHSLSQTSPAVPVRASLKFYERRMRSKTSEYSPDKGMGAPKNEASIDVIFSARINLYLIPNCALITCRLKAPGKIALLSRTNIGMLQPIDIRINMDSLYSAIRKECKLAAIEIINGIAGFTILEKKIISRRQSHETATIEEETEEQDGADGISSRTSDENASQISHAPSRLRRNTQSDAITQATVASTEGDDQSITCRFRNTHNKANLEQANPKQQIDPSIDEKHKKKKTRTRTKTRRQRNQNQRTTSAINPALDQKIKKKPKIWWIFKKKSK